MRFKRITVNPEAQGKLLLANLSTVTEALEQGSLVVLQDVFTRTRKLPIAGAR
jgi:hypothetical protein